MKKVYGSLNLLLITIGFIGLFLGGLAKNGKLNLFLSDTPPQIVFGLFLLFSLVSAISSFWAYDEKGLETRTIKGKFIKKYTWEDVLRITREQLYKNPWFPWISLEMNDGVKINISFFLTRDYLRVLSDVVRYVQNKNSKAYIDMWVLKKVARYL